MNKMKLWLTSQIEEVEFVTWSHIIILGSARRIPIISALVDKAHVYFMHPKPMIIRKES